MSLVYQCDVFCDVCGAWVPNSRTGASHQGLSKSALDAAKKAGWFRVRQDAGTVDLCPECAKGSPNER